MNQTEIPMVNVIDVDKGCIGQTLIITEYDFHGDDRLVECDHCNSKDGMCMIFPDFISCSHCDYDLFETDFH